MKFSVATWNCFGMGQSVLDVITHLRAPFRRRFLSPEVIQECADSDVLCVQELLSRDSQRFFDGLVTKYFPFAVRDHNRFGFLSLRGSGLGVGTRAVKDATVVAVKKATPARFLPFKSRGVSWDRYARKGGLYTQLEFDGQTIDLMTVHLQAGYSIASRRARTAQLAELKAWVTELGSKDRPFIVCGDFNIQGLAAERDGGEYLQLISALDGFTDLGAESDLPTYHPHPEGNPLAHLFEKQGNAQRLDYIFFRPASRNLQLVPSGLRRFFDRPLTSLGEGISSWASDHYGLKATFEI
ncbi:endonuclease/exonuclease/phosphatase family protein [Turneriella parva]|uniref:Endonuclease/exonuclease/phosphatase n=1 Tax=Turneriella parva (strain ATCC BAA-1111 / DSM 21527 / NCTC 11395 / H) TaxID=869212 RepID=I4B4Y7_TURPD|nr:endonuclease/exonuclease/phosphatase family protein [Turneriella parva]AFM12344.1 Endonuclease/exonuclease/phosphatase [Turneriella parva DSM 21527]